MCELDEAERLACSATAATAESDKLAAAIPAVPTKRLRRDVVARRAVVGSFMHQGPVYGLITTVVGGGGALVLYALCSRLLGIEEFRTLMKSVAGRFR